LRSWGKYCMRSIAILGNVFVRGETILNVHVWNALSMVFFCVCANASYFDS